MKPKIETHFKKRVESFFFISLFTIRRKLTLAIDVHSMFPFYCHRAFCLSFNIALMFDDGPTGCYQHTEKAKKKGLA